MADDSAAGGVGARIQSERLQCPFDELDVVGGLLVVLLPNSLRRSSLVAQPTAVLSTSTTPSSVSSAWSSRSRSVARPRPTGSPQRSSSAQALPKDWSGHTSCLARLGPPPAPRRPTLEQQSRLAACHPGARLVRMKESRRIRPAWDTSARDDQPTEALGAIAVKHALRKWPARDPVLCLADEQRTLVYGWLSCFGDPTTTGRTAKRSSTIRSG